MTDVRRVLVKIPQASAAVPEGTIVRWPAAGTLHLPGEAGQTYAVGADVGSIDGTPATGA